MDHLSMLSDTRVRLSKMVQFFMAHPIHNLVQWLHKHLLAAALCYVGELFC